jgi:NHLM bacteriocin system ABC transporter ATP-binding protein
MTKAGSNDLLRRGVRIQTGSNEPFWVHDPRNTWFVEKGSVDLFIVPMADGNPAGPRNHLLRISAGQIIGGIERNGAEREVGFLAVAAPQSRVYRLPVHDLRTAFDWAAGSVEGLLETWIDAVYNAMTAEETPTECDVVDVDSELDAPPGAVIRTRDQLVWINHCQGRSLVAGNPDLAVGGDDVPVPLASSAWLLTETPVSLSCLGTAALLRGGRLEDALRRFGQLATRWAGARVAIATGNEAARLQSRAGAQGRSLRNALTNLSSVLSVRAAPAAAALDEDPLLVACLWVGDGMGIRIVAPLSTPLGGKRGDPLDRIARASHVRVRRVVLSGEWWRQDGGPLLAFRAEGHEPVALIPASSTRYRLVDPSTGRRERVTEEVARSLSGLAFCFCTTFPDEAIKVWHLLQLGLRNRREVVTVLATALGGVILGMIFPIITGIIFDSVIPSAARSQLWYLGVALLIASIAEIMLGVTQSVALMRVETKSDVTVQSAVWDRLLRLPLPFFRDYQAGDLAQRVNGINGIRQMLYGVALTSVLSGVFSVLYFGLLCYYSSKLTLVACGLVIANLAVVLANSAVTLRLQRPQYELEGRLSGMVLQLITGIAKIRVAGAEPQAFAVWAKMFSAQRQLDWRWGMWENAFGIFDELFPILATMLLFTGSVLWAAPNITTGKFLAFSACFMIFLHTTRDAGAALISVVHAVPLFERAKPILEALPEVSESKADPGLLTGCIELSQVCFRYKADGPAILQDVSLQIKPGELVALVGPSGSGKSTILRLLLGFERPQSGAIFYNGLDLAGLDVQTIRRQCGVVLQSSKLMPGDIFQNIVGSSLWTLDDAWQAARMAGLDEDIRAMPMGMHTILGEGASTLSGGQRQRLMIARAIVAKPRILLFDEATSALDNRTQAVVSRSLASLRATRIVIAHRLSTIENADRICVLVKGCIAQSGSFQELSDQPGPFAEFVRRQVV